MFFTASGIILIEKAWGQNYESRQYKMGIRNTGCGFFRGQFKRKMQPHLRFPRKRSRPRLNIAAPATGNKGKGIEGLLRSHDWRVSKLSISKISWQPSLRSGGKTYSCSMWRMF